MAADEERGGGRRRWGIGAVVVLVLGALAVTVAVGVVRTATAPRDELPLPSTSIEAAGLFVDVAGAVRAPGLYRLAADARVVDAIAAAGGFTQDADRASLNLARGLRDGEQLVVGVAGSQGPASTPSSAAGAVAGSTLVNLNTADVALLDTLPRIGPAIAQRIVAWRDQNGGFASVDDLLAVPGIGEKLLAGIRDLVTV